MPHFARATDHLLPAGPGAAVPSPHWERGSPPLYLYSSLARAALETLSAVHARRTPFTLSGEMKAVCELELLVTVSALNASLRKACVRKYRNAD